MVERSFRGALQRSAKKTKAFAPRTQGRRLDALRGTTLIRPGYCYPDPSFSPYGAKRNPLLVFHGFWLGGEFSIVETGLHHPPALLIRRMAYYSSSLP